VVDSVNRALERVKERETSSLRKGLGGLATIASITPFVGLFGTVFGIIHAFDLLKTGGGIAVVGPSIAEALYSTAVGLGVAIPAAMAFNYFTGRVESFVVDMSDVSSEFIDFVLKEGRS
jgi:biopolymer transport protein ExbB/TolQ